MKTLLFLALCIFAVPAYADTIQPLRFEKVISGNVFAASGKLIQLWGIKPPDPESAYGYAARMYLASMLDQKPIRCEPAGGEFEMRCQVDNTDVASNLIRMGVATATNPAYEAEERFARKNHYGIWKR